MIEMGDFVGDKDKFCTDCAMMPCSCLLTYLNLKLQTLVNNNGRAGDSREESRKREAEDASEDAGHQHQCLEADAEHQKEGQLHHPQHQGDGVDSIGDRTVAPQKPASRKRKAGGQLHHHWGDGAAHQNSPKMTKKSLPDDDRACVMMDDERGLHLLQEHPLNHEENCPAETPTYIPQTSLISLHLVLHSPGDRRATPTQSSQTPPSRRPR